MHSSWSHEPYFSATKTSRNIVLCSTAEHGVSRASSCFLWLPLDSKPIWYRFVASVCWCLLHTHREWIIAYIIQIPKQSVPSSKGCNTKPQVSDCQSRLHVADSLPSKYWSTDDVTTLLLVWRKCRYLLSEDWVTVRVPSFGIISDGLFNDAINRYYVCLASSDKDYKRTVNLKGRERKKQGPKSRYCPAVCLDELRKTKTSRSRWRVSDRQFMPGLQLRNRYATGWTADTQ
jgi:hypothetical protein